MTLIRAALTALVYTDSAAANRALRSAARRIEAAGCRLAGLVQRDDARADRACRMNRAGLDRCGLALPRAEA